MRIHTTKQRTPASSRHTSQNAAGQVAAGPSPQRAAVRHILRGPQLQTKLTVGPANDKYEREADRVAEQVVNSEGIPATEVHHAENSIQRMCSECEEEAEENAVQRKSGSNANAIMPAGTASYIQSLRGGVPLSQSESQYFEPRFGQSFSDVRIHTGDSADRAAKSINARAFTLGNNIAFANGEHDFGSVSGRKLLAHELTHTLQQSSGDADSVQRGSAGIFGGKCCLRSPRVEWALVGDGVWKKLEQGECTGTTEDCDGMTCGGGFYHVDNLTTATCRTPRNDDATFTPRRWTPSSQGANAHSPTQEGSTQGDTPPNWVYDSAGTTACRDGIRTITIDSIRLHGSTGAPAAQIARANTIYAGCCVQFKAGATPRQESQATTESWLGSDTDVDVSGITCADTTVEEKQMYDQATRAHSLSSRMRVFYVETFSGYTGAGFSRPPYCSGGDYANHVILDNNTNTTDLAHELGHILLNSGNHSSDNQNLMFATNNRGTNLTAAQCATIYGNA